MQFPNGEGMLDSLSPEALVGNQDLLHGFARQLGSLYQISVKPMELVPRGGNIIHTTDNGLNFKIPINIAYKISLQGAIKNYVSENDNLSPAIVTYEINGITYAPSVKTNVIDFDKLPENVADLEILYGKMKNRPSGTLLTYTSRGSRIGDAKPDPKTIDFEPAKKYMRLLSREQLKVHVRDPLFDRILE